MFFLSLVIAGLVVLTALSLHSDHPEALPSFEHMYAAHELSGGLLLGAVLLEAFFLVRGGQGLLPAALENIPSRLAANPFPLLALVTVILAAAAPLVYRARPLNIDEYSLYFQAEIFAEGRIAGRFPKELVPWLVSRSHWGHFFAVSPQSGGIVTAYWPGFSLLLAPFMKLGVPWLLNPLLTTGSLYLLWLLSRRLFPQSAAPGWVLLFCLGSPVVTVSALSFYAMTSHLFLNLLYAWLLLELTPRRLLLAGLVGSLALVQHNPVPHLLFALPWLVRLMRQPRRARNVSLLALGYLPLAILLGFGWVWVKMKVSQGLMPLMQTVATTAGAQGADGLISAPQAPSVAGAVLREPYRLLSTILTLPDLDFLWLRLLGILKIFAWAVPGLPLLAYLGGAKPVQAPEQLRLWWWAAILTLVGYLFVPASQGHGWGFRYFHSAWAALPLLAVSCLAQPRLLSEAGRQVLLVVTLLSIVCGNGLRFWQVYDFIQRHRAQLPPLVTVAADKVQLVFIDAGQGYYSQDLVQNDPSLREDTVYLISRGAALNSRLLATYFPSATKVGQKGLHSVWLVDKQDWLKMLGS